MIALSVLPVVRQFRCARNVCVSFRRLTTPNDRQRRPKRSSFAKRSFAFSSPPFSQVASLNANVCQFDIHWLRATRSVYRLARQPRITVNVVRIDFELKRKCQFIAYEYECYSRFFFFRFICTKYPRSWCNNGRTQFHELRQIKTEISLFFESFSPYPVYILQFTLCIVEMWMDEFTLTQQIGTKSNDQEQRE